MSRRTILILALVLGAGGPGWARPTRCWIDDGALVASGRFGDIAGDFLVDTAAPYSELNQTEANAAGFAGPFATATLGLAHHRWDGVRLPLVSLDFLPQTDTAIVGVIGQDVLSRYALQVRFRPCRLSLLERNPRNARGPGLRRLSLAGLPAVHAAYGDGSESRREPMLVSTGRWESLIPRSRLSRVPAEGAHPLVRVRWIAFGGRRLSPTSAGVADSASGSLGMSVLTRWRGFSLTRDRMILRP